MPTPKTIRRNWTRLNYQKLLARFMFVNSEQRTPIIMPKLTSSSRIRSTQRDKENEAPTMAHYSRKHMKEYNNEEDIKSLKHGGGGSSSSRVHHSSSNYPKERNGSSSSNSKDTEMYKSSKDSRHHREGLKEKRSYDQVEENSEIRKKERYDVPENSSDVQGQFDELYSLRHTEPERNLLEWQKMAEQKSKKAEEYIAILKKQVESLSHHSQERNGPTMPSVNERENKDFTSLQLELEDMRKREKQLKEENARQARQLESLRLQTGTSTSSTAYRLGLGSSQMGMGDERAVRRLYEDLTGLMINKVEQVEGREDFRRFHAIFACAGYHDLEIKLEESTSDLPSIVPGTSNGPREDLVYTPTLDQDRDAELLQSGRLPEFLKDSIRFERATSVKFMTTLHKRLDRHSKK